MIDFDDLNASAEFVCNIFQKMSLSARYKTNFPYCEPQLGKRNLYYEPCTGSEFIQSYEEVGVMLNLLYYADGEHDLVDLAIKQGVSLSVLSRLAQALEARGILSL